jgi:formylglycine-generating enzyme required for sulfatase activity
MKDKAESGFDFYLDKPSKTLLPAQANFKDSDLKRPCQVGSYLPNRLGLYDMHGNVWEWCQDEAPADPKDPKGASRRVYRGGGWSLDSGGCRAASRDVRPPSSRGISLGLRVARVPISEFSVNPLTVDEKEAKRQQEEWATKLKLPVEATNKIGMKMILIPPAGAALPKPYYLGKYEVTQAEWEKVMNYNPSGFGPKDAKVAAEDTSKFPVESVSWFDSVEFCNKLSEREGLKPYYDLNVTKRGGKDGKQIDAAEVKILGGSGYRIPTDAEWTCGCAAGAKTKYHFGDKDDELPEYAWFKDNSEGRPHAVGEKKPNAFGLYDMHGNVREWNEEMLTKAATGAPERVNRGGHWINAAGSCAVSHLSRNGPAYRSDNYGLRVARVP